MMLPLEPSSSPQSVQASAKNSTSVSVSWAAVVNKHRNGIIKGYKVIYQALPGGENVTRFVNISDENQETEQDITLGDLVKFTNYTIRVLHSLLSETDHRVKSKLFKHSRTVSYIPVARY